MNKTEPYMTEEDIRRFNKYMSEAGYNVEKLSQEIGMSKKTLGSRIRGDTSFKYTEMVVIAETLKTPPGKIFFG